MPYDGSIIAMLMDGKHHEEKLKGDMAKQNYLHIHKKRKKR